MSYSVVLPEGYGYVIAAGAFCGIALTITGALAGNQRKRLGVEYPNLCKWTKKLSVSSDGFTKTPPTSRQRRTRRLTNSTATSAVR
jgi:hypothetical protein